MAVKATRSDGGTAALQAGGIEPLCHPQMIQTLIPRCSMHVLISCDLSLLPHALQLSTAPHQPPSAKSPQPQPLLLMLHSLLALSKASSPFLPLPKVPKGLEVRRSQD